MNAYWQTVYVHSRSIRYAIDFYSDQRKDIAGLARYKEQLKFPGSSQATYVYRSSYSQSDLILQTAVEKRLSKFELLKCCCRSF